MIKILIFVQFTEAIINKVTMTGPGQNLGGVARGGGADFGRRRAVRVARPRPAVPLPLPRLRQPSLLVVAVFFTTHNGGGDRRRGPAEHPTPTPTGPAPPRIASSGWRWAVWRRLRRRRPKRAARQAAALARAAHLEPAAVPALLLRGPARGAGRRAQDARVPRRPAPGAAPRAQLKCGPGKVQTLNNCGLLVRAGPKRRFPVVQPPASRRIAVPSLFLLFGQTRADERPPPPRRSTTGARRTSTRCWPG